MASSNSFYTASIWRKVRERKIIESGGVCNRCKKIFSDTSKLIVHHKEHLQGNDYYNIDKSYNDDNLEVICVDCHNKEHDRFKQKRTVYIIDGAPCSGKSTFVNENKSKDDIVIDMDLLYMAISGNQKYDKPDCLRFNVFRIRDLLLDQIYTKYGSWRNAWIIGGFSDSYTRDNWIKKLQAQYIYIDTPKEVCLQRLNECTDNRYKYLDEWRSYIEKWFRDYTPPSLD